MTTHPTQPTQPTQLVIPNVVALARDLFETWLAKVLKWINENYTGKRVLIVMDNASYHSRLTEDSITPTLSWRKDKLIEYMIKNKLVPPMLLPNYTTDEEVQAQMIACQARGESFVYNTPMYTGGPLPTPAEYGKLTKAVLVAHIPKKQKRYVTNEMCANAGVKLLRLPPYHCEFNPIELVWAKSNAEVAKRNVQYKLNDSMRIMKEEACKCDAEYWTKCETHAMKEEQYVRASDSLDVDPVSMTLTFESDESSSDDNDEEE